MRNNSTIYLSFLIAIFIVIGGIPFMMRSSAVMADDMENSNIFKSASSTSFRFLVAASLGVYASTAANFLLYLCWDKHSVTYSRYVQLNVMLICACLLPDIITFIYSVDLPRITAVICLLEAKVCLLSCLLVCFSSFNRWSKSSDIAFIISFALTNLSGCLCRILEIFYDRRENASLVILSQVFSYASFSLYILYLIKHNLSDFHAYKRHGKKRIQKSEVIFSILVFLVLFLVNITLAKFPSTWFHMKTKDLILRYFVPSIISILALKIQNMFVYTDVFIAKVITILRSYPRFPTIEKLFLIVV